MQVSVVCVPQYPLINMGTRFMVIQLSIWKAQYKRVFGLGTVGGRSSLNLRHRLLGVSTLTHGKTCVLHYSCVDCRKWS